MLAAGHGTLGARELFVAHTAFVQAFLQFLTGEGLEVFLGRRGRAFPFLREIFVGNTPEPAHKLGFEGGPRGLILGLGGIGRTFGKKGGSGHDNYVFGCFIVPTQKRNSILTVSTCVLSVDGYRCVP